MQFVNVSVQAFMAGVLLDHCTIWDHTFVLTFWRNVWPPSS